MTTDPGRQADGGSIVMPVVREEVHVSTVPVDTGRGVRIHKTVSEQARHIDETLVRDAVSVRRVPVDKVVSLTEAPVARQEGDTLIVPILEEILVVEKRLRIKEEIHITRTAQAESFTDTVMLRTEQVSVERFDEAPATEVNSTNGGMNHEAHTGSRI